MSIIRVSRAGFDAGLYPKVADMLAGSEQDLSPAIRRMAGCRYYSAGLDRGASAMVNVSVWDSRAEAEAMDDLADMQVLFRAFIAAGVRFERPVLNFDVVWSLP